MVRLHDVPITNDGAVVRSTVVAKLESQEFEFRKCHLEFACELSSNSESMASKYSPQYYTALECFFRHARGKCVINVHCSLFYNLKNFLSYGGRFDYHWNVAQIKAE